MGNTDTVENDCVALPQSCDLTCPSRGHSCTSLQVMMWLRWLNNCHSSDAGGDRARKDWKACFHNYTDRGTLLSEEIDTVQWLVCCVWEHDCVPCNHFPITHLSNRGVKNKVRSLNCTETNKVTFNHSKMSYLICSSSLLCVILDNLPDEDCAPDARRIIDFWWLRSSYYWLHYNIIKVSNSNSSIFSSELKS